MIPAAIIGRGTCRSVYSWRVSNINTLILCLVCTLLYLRMFSEVSVQTLQTQTLIKEGLDDLQISTSSVSLSSSDRHVKSEVTDVKMSKIKKENLRQYEQTDIPLLTLFTTWSSESEKNQCHNNTVKNWLSFKPHVTPLLFSNETDLVNDVQKKGWKALPISKSRNGIPVLKYMFMDAMREVSSHFYAYSNGDILFTDKLVASIKAILMSETINKTVPMMIVGQRTNVKDVTFGEASSWRNIVQISKLRGKLFAPFAEDFFITMKNYPWKDIPELVIGRRAYDNWLVLYSRLRNFTTVDITETSYAVHQTTNAGNFEGRYHKNSNLNHDLLRKLYRKLQYEKGQTTCTDKQTKWTADGQILIQNRKISKGCLPLS